MNEEFADAVAVPAFTDAEELLRNRCCQATALSGAGA